jgi:hypothetical protein
MESNTSKFELVDAKFESKSTNIPTANSPTQNAAPQQHEGLGSPQTATQQFEASNSNG